MASKIEIKEIKLMLHIGCSKEERSQAQPVIVRIAVHSISSFQACKTDQLSDTLDVDTISRLLINEANCSRVSTLERLGQILENSIRNNILNQDGFNWEVTLTKPQWGWSYVHSWIS